MTSHIAKFGFPNQTSWCPLPQDMPEGPCINITYEQLLSMSSGIHINPVHMGDYKGSVEAYVSLFINDPLLFMPGMNFSNSNPSFILATYMIEKLSGMRKCIFEHLG
jgi:CubicO group peptidase (beta-lactamase class C family)